MKRQSANEVAERQDMSDELPAPMFLADSPGLDFLNSIAVPVDTQVEWLADGAGLLNWLDQAKLVHTDILREIASNAGPGELDAVAGQARALREWFRGFVLQHKGSRLTRAAIDELEPLNRVLARDEVYGQIVLRDPTHLGPDAPSPLEFMARRRWRSPEALLLPIAKTLADLVATANFAHIKHCEGSACTILFLDTSRGHIRRWCSMAICGNRAKQALHRARRRTVKEGDPASR
ncbi:Zinc finger CGNR domain-containing protein [Cupriavidus sp. H19C3]